MICPERMTGRRAMRALGGWIGIAAAIWLILSGGANAAVSEARHPIASRILTLETTLTGGLLSNELDASGTPSAGSGVIAFQQLVQPTAVAGRGPDIYVADIGPGVIYRFDSRFQVMAALPGIRAYLGVQLYAGADLSIYILDQPSRRIFHYARSGQLLATFSDNLNIGRPVDVAWDERRGRVLVADALYNHLVAFHALGKASYVIPLRGRSGDQVVAVAGMAIGVEEIFISDPVCACIARASMDGVVVETFGDRFLSQPGPIAVDREQRVFVVDTFDGSLKIFFRGELIEELTAATFGLQKINDIWTHDGWVILSSGGAGAAVKILRISAGAPY